MFKIPFFSKPKVQVEQLIQPYSAVVAKIDHISSIVGADNIVAAEVLGNTLIVSKASKVGDIGLYFMPGIQLSPEFTEQNNLYRKSELNKDSSATGYLEENRRIKPLCLRGVQSNGLFLPIECLDYLQLKGKDASNVLTPGFSFFTITGRKVCGRYYTPTKVSTPRSAKGKRGIKGKFARLVRNVKDWICKVECDYDGFDIHKSTYFYSSNKHVFTDPEPKKVTVSLKLHGTSARYGNVYLSKKKTWFGGLISVEDVEGPLLVAGSRNVNFGGNSIPSFRKKYLDILGPHLRKGMVVYGEIVGFEDNGKSIMQSQSFLKVQDKEIRKKLIEKYGDTSHYKYGMKEGQSAFYIYRIVVNGVELPPRDINFRVKCFVDNGVQDVYSVYDLGVDVPLDQVDTIAESSCINPETLTEDLIFKGQVMEGLIVRVDDKTGTRFFKEKSFLFKLLESYYEIPESEEDEAELNNEDSEEKPELSQ